MPSLPMPRSGAGPRLSRAVNRAARSTNAHPALNADEQANIVEADRSRDLPRERVRDRAADVLHLA